MMKKVNLTQVLEMASKATPRQFLSNFKKLSEMINPEARKERE